MKPSESVKLGVLLGFIALAVAVVVHGPSDAEQALRSMQSNGVAGIWSTGLFLLKWMFYGIIFTIFAGGVCLILNALGVLTAIAEKIIGGLASVFSSASSKPAQQPIASESVVATTKSGAPITLGQMLNGLAAKIRVLEAKTVGLEPPPPPKSAEDTIAELQAELAGLRAGPVTPTAEAKV